MPVYPPEKAVLAKFRAVKPGRVIILGHFERPSDWANWLVNPFEALGWKVSLIDYRVTHRVMRHRFFDHIIKIVKNVQPQLFLTIKGESVPPGLINYIKYNQGAKTALWYPDDPQDYDRVSKRISGAYDHVFTSSTQTQEKYEEQGIKASWIGFHATERTFYKQKQYSLFKPGPPDKQYRCDVLFAGTVYPERVPVVQRTHKWCKDNGFKMRVYGSDWQGTRRLNIFEYIKAMHSAKITLNIHQSKMAQGGTKANLRCFEGLLSGSFVLTDMADGLWDVFDPDEEIGTYYIDQPEDLVSQLAYWLEAGDDRRAVARAGRDRVLREHLTAHRVQQILKELGF